MELMDIVAELKNASVQMPEEKIDQFIEAVDTHERIFVYGTGRSGLCAARQTTGLSREPTCW